MNNPSDDTRPDRWWLVSVMTAVVAMVAALAVFYLPASWSWVVGLGLVAFVLTYRLHPAPWYRRRAAAAMAVAMVTTLSPGLKGVLQWGPDTIGGVILENGLPAGFVPKT